MIVAELRILPLGQGTSMHEPLRHVVEALEQTGIRYEVGPLGTTLEAERMDQLLSAVQVAHDAARQEAARVVTELSIDDRQDKNEDARSLSDV